MKQMIHFRHHIFALMMGAALLPFASSCDDGGDTPPGGGSTASTVTVLSYDPAPGQFVNEMPEYTPGDTYDRMLAKAQTALDRGELISLGAWGGSVTLRLNKPIAASADGSPEFKVVGNAFINGTENGRAYGSCEPGIVEVMQDLNANGRPDDGDWALIPPGGQYLTGYSVTYTRHTAGDDDSQYIAWHASDGTSGWLLRVSWFHDHAMFPAWLDASQHTMTRTGCGIRIPDNGVRDDATGQYRLFAVDNTADCYPVGDTRGALRIADAVRPDGSPAHLTRIDFVRVTTGVLQCCGSLGEVSTEICGVVAL